MAVQNAPDVDGIIGIDDVECRQHISPLSVVLAGRFEIDRGRRSDVTLQFLTSAGRTILPSLVALV